MFAMAEILHYSPRDIDLLTVEEFNAAVEYIDRRQRQAEAEERRQNDL